MPTTSIKMVKNQDALNKDICKYSNDWDFTNTLNEIVWGLTSKQTSKNKLCYTLYWSVLLSSPVLCCLRLPTPTFGHCSSGHAEWKILRLQKSGLPLEGLVGAFLLRCFIQATSYIVN